MCASSAHLWGCSVVRHTQSLVRAFDEPFAGHPARGALTDGVVEPAEHGGVLVIAVAVASHPPPANQAAPPIQLQVVTSLAAALTRLLAAHSSLPLQCKLHEYCSSCRRAYHYRSACQDMVTLQRLWLDCRPQLGRDAYLR